MQPSLWKIKLKIDHLFLIVIGYVPVLQKLSDYFPFCTRSLLCKRCLSMDWQSVFVSPYENQRYSPHNRLPCGKPRCWQFCRKSLPVKTAMSSACCSNSGPRVKIICYLKISLLGKNFHCSTVRSWVYLEGFSVLCSCITSGFYMSVSRLRHFFPWNRQVAISVEISIPFCQT